MTSSQAISAFVSVPLNLETVQTLDHASHELANRVVNGASLPEVRPVGVQVMIADDLC